MDQERKDKRLDEIISLADARWLMRWIVRMVYYHHNSVADQKATDPETGDNVDVGGQSETPRRTSRSRTERRDLARRKCLRRATQLARLFKTAQNHDKEVLPSGGAGRPSLTMEDFRNLRIQKRLLEGYQRGAT